MRGVHNLILNRPDEIRELGSDQVNLLLLYEIFFIEASFLALNAPFWPQNGAFKERYRKTVSRKDATAQRKTFLHFDLILNRKDAKGAKVFLIALRAGYSTFVNSVGNLSLNRKDAKSAKGVFLLPCGQAIC